MFARCQIRVKSSADLSACKLTIPYDAGNLAILSLEMVSIGALYIWTIPVYYDDPNCQVSTNPGL